MYRHRSRQTYPERALKARIEGAVVLEASISPSGCVRDVNVCKSIALLDLAAINAVSNWRYSPTVIDGQPIPIQMTVTVNFRLQ